MASLHRVYTLYCQGRSQPGSRPPSSPDERLLLYIPTVVLAPFAAILVELFPFCCSFEQLADLSLPIIHVVPLSATTCLLAIPAAG